MTGKPPIVLLVYSDSRLGTESRLTETSLGLLNTVDLTNRKPLPARGAGLIADVHGIPDADTGVEIVHSTR